jgi:hypothetical protein
MRWLLVIALVVGLAGVSFAAAPADRIPMKLLYAGKPGSDREKDFVAFLKQHFGEVQTGDFAKFDSQQADGFDVVLLDWDGDGFKAPHPAIARDYTRPTVTIGVTGAFVCSQRGLKTGYT